MPSINQCEPRRFHIGLPMDIGQARIESVTLPTDVEAKLFVLMNRLGLVYGAINMRRRPDGSQVFLEVNPAGQWLFIERSSGQPITAALAELLQDKDGQGGRKC